jgi:hypothetical protein
MLKTLWLFSATMAIMAPFILSGVRVAKATDLVSRTGQSGSGSSCTVLFDGNQCKPWPYTGWCSGSAWAYEPGVGKSWKSARETVNE